MTRSHDDHDHHDAPLTLVIGSTGKTGRRVLTRLRELGRPVREGSRGSEPRFDWDDAQTWAPALAGVDRVYLSYYPELATPGAAKAIEVVVRTAVASDVRRIVLLSGRNEPEAKAAEDVVRASGLETTIVRCAAFSQNFSEGAFVDAVRSGVLALPAGSVAEPFLDAEDIADVAAAALTADRHVGEVYELTGPRLLTFAQAAAEIGAAAGRDVRYLQVTPEEFLADLSRAGVPLDFASMLADLFVTIFDGRNETTADGVQRALGRAPRDFSAYVNDPESIRAWVA